MNLKNKTKKHFIMHPINYCYLIKNCYVKMVLCNRLMMVNALYVKYVAMIKSHTDNYIHLHFIFQQYICRCLFGSFRSFHKTTTTTTPFRGVSRVIKLKVFTYIADFLNFNQFIDVSKWDFQWKYFIGHCIEYRYLLHQTYNIIIIIMCINVTRCYSRFGISISSIMTMWIDTKS